MIAPVPETSLRLGRLEWMRLARVLAFSAALHLSVWGGYEAGKKLGLWEKWHLPAWMQKLTQLMAVPVRTTPSLPLTEKEPPLVFVEVNDLVKTDDAPKNATHYSSKNAQAANPDADRDTNIPKIDGTQEQVPRTADVDRNRPQQLQPSAPQPEEQSKPKPKLEMGDLALAKPDPNPRTDDGKSDQPRPRTLVEARTRQQLNKIPGQKMKQDGGVKRQRIVSAFDTKATPFGAYDEALIEAVQSHWYDLLDSRNAAGYSSGRVVVRFRLNYDGTVSDVEIVESNVDTIMKYLCQKAISDPAPYEKWPADMRRMNNGDYRELTFTFYYN